jgi:uncharacterized membrane protein YqiK
VSNLTTMGIIAAVIVVALITVGLILARLYRRASKEISFVRTGFRGQKVIMNGGALVLPVLHEVIPVNMNTLRLEVRRANEQALITHDRMRVDVTAEFYVRVKPTEDSIANAAQTLGVKTMNPEALKELVEGKFVDALRAVAAEMEMEQLHEKRVDFVQKVQQVTAEDLLKNGLELESVSLTGLDQTSFEYFNPQNAFDAEGLTRLTETIESRRKTRNDIEQETEVQIKTKNLDAERKRLELEREEEYARLEQQREIETRRAAQSSEISREQAIKEREAQEAQIAAEREVESARIAAERAVEEERIEKERQLKEKDIQRNRAIETAEVERRQSVRLSEQDSEIAVAEKSRAESDAQAAASRARAAAVKEQEAVETVRETERAERLKAVELVEARQQAERDAISITVAAEAEKQAAQDRAESLRIEAEAEAEKARIGADAEAQAEKLRADAAAVRYQVEAEGKRALNEANNTLSAEQIAMQVRMALIENLPGIIRESVRPMEQIDGIKIIQVDGLNGGGGSYGGGEPVEAGNGSLADQVVSSALRYRAQGPLVDSLLKEIGLQAGDLNGMTGALQNVDDENAKQAS